MTAAVIVPALSVPCLWESVKGYISLCDGHVSTSEDLYPLLLNGERGLVIIVEGKEIKGACVYRLIEGFDKVALITTLGGNDGNWNLAIDSFSAQLKKIGVKRLEIQGRKGWSRSLSGFKLMHTTIGKEL